MCPPSPISAAPVTLCLCSLVMPAVIPRLPSIVMYHNHNYGTYRWWYAISPPAHHTRVYGGTYQWYTPTPRGMWCLSSLRVRLRLVRSVWYEGGDPCRGLARGSSQTPPRGRGQRSPTPSVGKRPLSTTSRHWVRWGLNSLNSYPIRA